MGLKGNIDGDDQDLRAELTTLNTSCVVWWQQRIDPTGRPPVFSQRALAANSIALCYARSLIGHTKAGEITYLSKTKNKNYS